MDAGAKIYTSTLWEPPPGRFADDTVAVTPTAVRVPLKRLDAFLAEYEPLEYAVEPIVRTGSLYTLTARTGAGKTAWLISLALALATGRRDILGLDVERGRVALLTFENPDDVRMRLKVSSWFLAVEVREIVDRLLILDARVKPEDAIVELTEAAAEAPLRLVLIDTLAAFFDGDNINDNVQGGGFMRRLRPITRLPGRPAVVVAAHPVKNAPQDNLLPYGGGAILNEVDGNLTLWRRSEGPAGIVELHWQGKLRGLEFAPIPFRFEITSSPEVTDAKGREVSLPTMLPVV
ncbi:AAA family ATPase, partial [Lichenibacterium ramalinae]